MPRYIQEYKLTIEGGKHKLPTCSKILGITKILNYFVLIVEVWGNPNIVYEVDVRVFRKQEYLLPELNYIGHVLVGSDLYHFGFFTGEVEDLGGDGGEAPEDREDLTDTKPKVGPVIKKAGGMSES